MTGDTAAPAAEPFGLDAVAEHHWRFAPHLMAAYLTANDLEPYLTPAHVRYVGQRIAQAVAKGGAKLAISLPPQIGKTALGSQYTPTWFQHVTDGRGRALLASYEATFAEQLGAKNRDQIERWGPELGIALSKKSTAASHFTLTAGGTMTTAGIGGAFAGLPGDLIIIDDPIKNFEEAHSKARRLTVWNWFLSVALARRQPQSTMIVISTRWHTEDLIGNLAASDMAHEWEFIRIPALCDDPAADPLGRAVGESIWPERYNEEWYDSVRRTVGAYIWAGSYQQLPAPVAGNLFQRDTWRFVNELPNTCRLVRSWDFAGTESNSADYTVGLLMALDPATNNIYVVDIIRGRWDVSKIDALIVQTAQLDQSRYGRRVRIRLEQEPGSSGKKWAQSLIAALSGYQVTADAPDKNKFLRALPFGAQQQAGNVSIMTVQTAYGWQPPPWAQEYIEELALFDGAPHDDQVDASSAAYDELINGPKPAKVRMQTAADAQL
jgi:predicted phage terminase large subunit-like protein